MILPMILQQGNQNKKDKQNPQNTTTFTLQYYSGSPEYRIPLKVTFEQGKDYLVFLVQDIRYNVAYGDPVKSSYQPLIQTH